MDDSTAIGVLLKLLLRCPCRCFSRDLISGRELSFVSDVAHECAAGYHAARFVAWMRADALRQWGRARSRSKQTVGLRSQPTKWKSYFIPLMARV